MKRLPRWSTPFIPMLLLSPLLGAPARSYTAGNFSLDLNGAAAGWIKSVDGGDIRGEVVALPPALINKHIGGIRYEPFELQVGAPLGQPLLDWINGTLRREAPRRSGVVTAADANFRAVSRRTFTDALISEIEFPALDGASKDAAYFTVKFAAEQIRQDKASGQIMQSNLPARQKQWLTSNFRFELGNLPCSRVAKIDGFTVKQGVAVEIPNLKVSFSATDLDAWQKWFDDFVVRGNNGQGQELGGKIDFLDATMKQELATISLGNVGIVALYPEAAEAGRDGLARYVAELYVETLELKAEDLR